MLTQIKTNSHHTKELLTEILMSFIGLKRTSAHCGMDGTSTSYSYSSSTRCGSRPCLLSSRIRLLNLFSKSHLVYVVGVLHDALIPPLCLRNSLFFFFVLFVGTCKISNGNLATAVPELLRHCQWAFALCMGDPSLYGYLRCVPTK